MDGWTTERTKTQATYRETAIYYDIFLVDINELVLFFPSKVITWFVGCVVGGPKWSVAASV